VVVWGGGGYGTGQDWWGGGQDGGDDGKVQGRREGQRGEKAPGMKEGEGTDGEGEETRESKTTLKADINKKLQEYQEHRICKYFFTKLIAGNTDHK
jgi:hypothetical protein